MFKTTETNVTTFNSAQFGDLRTHQTADGIVLFCLSDVANALGLEQVSRLKSRLNEKGVTIIKTPTNGGLQDLNFINEPNLYRCIFQSRKAEAEQFQNWVFEEVLPSIRKTGGYIATTQEDTPELIMARALQVAQATIERSKHQLQIAEGERDQYKKEVQQLAPLAEYTKEVLQSTSTFTATQMAKDFGMSAVTFNRKLKDLGIIFYQSGQWFLTAKYQNKGYTDMRVTKYIDRKTGEVKTSQSLVWTEKGRAFLHHIMNAA